MEIIEYAQLDAVGLAQAIASGEITANEVRDCAVEAHAQVNGRINAVVALHPSALEGDPSPVAGTFSGVPMLVKDLFHGHAGEACGNGSRLSDAWVVPQTTNIFARAQGAGFVDLGRTATSEFGIMGTTETLANGQTRSPWSLDHIAGGSSGGAAAAVGAGIVPVALASDGGGSIRIPASACGVVGLKPSAGRVPWGHVTTEPLMGWAVQFAVTRTVRDSAAMLDVLSGPVPGDPFGLARPTVPFTQAAQTPTRLLRIACWTEPWSGHAADPVITGATLETAQLLQSLGHVVEIATPTISWEQYLPAMTDVWAATNAYMIDGFAAALGREVNAETLEGPTLALVEYGRTVPASKLLEAIDLGTQLTYVMEDFFSRYDVLLTPTLATVPPRLGEYDPVAFPTARETFASSSHWDCFLPIFNTTGQPAISLPLHQSPDGLPIGMQLVSAMGREDVLLALATALEEALPWAGRRPPVFAA